MDDSDLTSEHVKAARALLRWEQKKLAEVSGVSLPTIGRLEMQPGPLGGYKETVATIRKTFEDHGIEFMNGGNPGVRLVKAPKADRAGAAKASGMAGREIDRLVDKSAPAEEQQKRKRRLLKGPPEFRDMRRDRRKAKPAKAAKPPKR